MRSVLLPHKTTKQLERQRIHEINYCKLSDNQLRVLVSTR